MLSVSVMTNMHCEVFLSRQAYIVKLWVFMTNIHREVLLATTNIQREKLVEQYSESCVAGVDTNAAHACIPV